MEMDDVSSGEDFLEEIENVFTCFEKPSETPADQTKIVDTEVTLTDIIAETNNEVLSILSSNDIEQSVSTPERESKSSGESTPDVAATVVESPHCSSSIPTINQPNPPTVFVDDRSIAQNVDSVDGLPNENTMEIDFEVKEECLSKHDEEEDDEVDDENKDYEKEGNLVMDEVETEDSDEEEEGDIVMDEVETEVSDEEEEGDLVMDEVETEVSDEEEECDLVMDEVENEDKDEEEGDLVLKDVENEDSDEEEEEGDLVMDEVENEDSEEEEEGDLVLNEVENEDSDDEEEGDLVMDEVENEDSGEEEDDELEDKNKNDEAEDKNKNDEVEDKDYEEEGDLVMDEVDNEDNAEVEDEVENELENGIKDKVMDNDDEVVVKDVDEDDGEDENLNKCSLSYLRNKFPCTTRVKRLNSPNGRSTGYTQEVALPIDSLEVPLIPISKTAKKFKFPLDPFQKAALICIDNYQSVLISAHTSAGKTVAAEYAIAKAFKDNQRVIYTTPIKALSNQKYREFLAEFGDVGIITGDVSINPNASCLVMTTEVLRQMLYRGSEITREIGWVIFDEIHYMKDPSRGVVWEETIILLPSKAHFVFLSATIPNATQFAQWIAAMHKQPCNVIYTDFRPVPLHHYIYSENTDELVKVTKVNPSTSDATFNEEMFIRIQNSIDKESGGSEIQQESPVKKVLTKLIHENKTPVIIFSFSKAECELQGVKLSDVDFNTDEEKDLIKEVFTNAVDILSPEDQQLPQVVKLLPLLLRGVGIHHGGLLPIMKETVEILFSEGLVKILCATETFAMGLNMPAHTVVFTNLYKFDGVCERMITPGEYIQMSGRAGRRSFDKYGNCVVIMDERLTLDNAKKIFMGRPDPIDSSFRLTYNMILNLMRTPEINPEYMIEKSFYHFQSSCRIPDVCSRVETATKEVEKYKEIVPMQEEIATYFKLRKELAEMSKEFNSIIRKPKNLLPFLQTGRMVHILGNQKDFGWGLIANYVHNKNDQGKSENYIVNVLINVSEIGASSKSTTDISPLVDGNNNVAVILPVCLETIYKISKIRVACPNDLNSEENKSAALRNMQKALDDMKEKIPVMDPVKDMKIHDPKFQDIIKKIQHTENQLYNHPLHQNDCLPELYNWHYCKIKAYEILDEERGKLNAFKELINNYELKNRKRVLRRLEYLSCDDIVQLKGKVACEITGCDELLLTEMIFHGVFMNLDAAQCIAILSCLVCKEKSKMKIKLAAPLQQSFDKIKELAKNIGVINNDCNAVTMDPKTYVNQFKPVLVNAVLEWCRGCTFAKLLEITDVYEGSIIRSMRSIDEILRQITQAAKVMGNKELEMKFSEGMTLIKRDIIFAASLYL